MATLATLWVVAIGVGLAMLWDYQNSSGVAGVPPSQWPANSSVELASRHATLVMVAHPNCPCTRSSIGELALLMGDNDGRSAIVALVTGEEAAQAETPVFGCSLVGDADACGKGEELCSK